MKFINCLDSKTPVFCLAKLSYPTQLGNQSIVRVLKVANISASDAWDWWHIVVSNAETASSFAAMKSHLGLETAFLEREKFDEIGGEFNSWEEGEIFLDLSGWHLVEDVANFFSDKRRIYLPLAKVEKIWMIDKDKTCLIDG